MFHSYPMIPSPLAERKQTDLLPGRYANNSHVREVLVAAATRTRTLSAATLVGTLSLCLLAFGMNWSALSVIAFGTLLYGSLVARDSIDEKFLAKHLPRRQISDENGEVNPEDPETASLEGLEEGLRSAYEGVLLRISELLERVNSGPAILQASIPEAKQICDTLLANGQRLVSRGQRIADYLQSTKLADLSESAAMVAVLGADSKDLAAARIYRQVVSGKRRQIATHVEVQGMYDRVLAQLMLMEATLAGAIASFVKITAAEDEESSLTAHLITTELEVLVRDVACLEQGLEEVCQDDSPTLAEKELPVLP